MGASFFIYCNLQKITQDSSRQASEFFPNTWRRYLGAHGFIYKMADLNCSATMAKPNRKRGRPRLFTTPEKKKKFYKMLGRRVFLGDTFVEWRNLRKKLGMNRDSELARVLLDRFVITENYSITGM